MRGRPGLDRKLVLQAAVELANEAGIEQVTLAALAQRLQVKTPSLYNHIEGLPGLRRLLALHGMEQLREHVAAATVGRAGVEAVMAAGTAYLQFVRQHPGLYDATVSVPDPQDTELRAASQSMVALMVQVLEHYRLSLEDSLHTVRAFRSLVHGFASLEQRGGFQMELDRDESFRQLLRTYLAGLAQMASGS